MAVLQDHPCQLRHDSCITPEVAKALDLRFPDAYRRADCLAEACKYIRKQDGLGYCHLPMCHTLEGDAMGANINYGNENFGPRAGTYVYDKPEDLLSLPDMDFGSGHMAQLLEACETLTAEGEHIMYDVDGPFTTLGTLIDMKHLFKAFRSKPEIVSFLYAHLERNLLAYVEELVSRGVTLLSYADSSGSVGILGPKLCEQVLRDFTVPFLKKAIAQIRGRALIVLCPKTSHALIALGLASWEPVALEKPMSYQDGILASVGKVEMLGESCVKNQTYFLQDGMISNLQLL